LIEASFSRTTVEEFTLSGIISATKEIIISLSTETPVVPLVGTTDWTMFPGDESKATENPPLLFPYREGAEAPSVYKFKIKRLSE
jgi:hypothetical protein